MTPKINTSPLEWHLHIGAHKTATTHLQESLGALRSELAKKDVGVATVEQVRPARALDLRPRRPKVWLAGAPLRREIEMRIATQTPLRSRMVVSEEDILGNATGPIHSRFYPYAGFRMRKLATALLTGGRGGIWLSVRSLDRFLPAAYATALKHMPLSFTTETLKSRTLQTPPDWSALVARLAQAAPGVPITVWDYGDYRSNSHSILEDITGVTLKEVPVLPDPPATKTPDAAAILTAEKLPRADNPHLRAQQVGEIYEAATGPRFDLFTPDEAQKLKALHQKQIATIRQMPNVRFLAF